MAVKLILLILLIGFESFCNGGKEFGAKKQTKKIIENELSIFFDNFEKLIYGICINKDFHVDNQNRTSAHTAGRFAELSLSLNMISKKIDQQDFANLMAKLLGKLAKRLANNCPTTTTTKHKALKTKKMSKIKRIKLNAKQKNSSGYLKKKTTAILNSNKTIIGNR